MIKLSFLLLLGAVTAGAASSSETVEVAAEDAQALQDVADMHRDIGLLWQTLQYDGELTHEEVFQEVEPAIVNMLATCRKMLLEGTAKDSVEEQIEALKAAQDFVAAVNWPTQLERDKDMCDDYTPEMQLTD